MTAPERIWACMDGPMVGLFVSGGINMGWPEYIRADLPPTLEAALKVPEIAALLKAAIDIDQYGTSLSYVKYRKALQDALAAVQP
jgi:hypothetical protein